MKLRYHPFDSSNNITFHEKLEDQRSDGTSKSLTTQPKRCTTRLRNDFFDIEISGWMHSRQYKHSAEINIARRHLLILHFHLSRDRSRNEDADAGI
jgi:hypothetical protein